MKKRAVASILAVCLTFAVTAIPPALSVTGLANFDSSRTYSDRFSDVLCDAWYYEYVKGAYEYAVIDGIDGDLFMPDGKLSIAQAIKLAACLHKCYYTGSVWFAASEPWYGSYVEYAKKNGIITGDYKNCNAAASRADFAAILANALPDEALTPLVKLPDGSIPDVYESFGYGPAVYKLYRAGILTGADADGTFYPGRTIRRAEAAAAVLRMIDADSRAALPLSVPSSPEDIFKTCSPAVFFVEIFDAGGDLVKTGSGFFISDSGLAVTNHHVVAGAHSAKITASDGEIYDVAGIYSHDRKKDIAIIQINGNSFPYLEIADSDTLLTGAPVYTIGSPLGLQNSFSSGIISGTPRIIQGVEYIQIDAVISSGSSGGALLDRTGRVVGITSAAVDGGQSLNLAVPINLINTLSQEFYVPLASIIENVKFYDGHSPVPDFGAYYDVQQYKPVKKQKEATYSYLVSNMPGDPDVMLDGYIDLLEQNLFTLFGYYNYNDNDFTAYNNSKLGIFVLFGIETLDGKECITVQIS